jgi:mevalonate pyrophosphate decarboxylase
MFIIFDKTIKELIGIFENYNDAHYYYIKNNLIERLKLYRHSILSSEEKISDVISKTRDVETLIEDIIDLMTEDTLNYEKIQFKYNMAVDLLKNTKYSITMNILNFCDNIRTCNLNY